MQLWKVTGYIKLHFYSRNYCQGSKLWKKGPTKQKSTKMPLMSQLVQCSELSVLQKKKKKKWRHAYCCSLNNGTTISLVPTLKKHIYLVLVLSLLMEAHHIISSTTNIKKEKALTDWPSSPPCQFFSGGSYVLLLTATGSVTCRTLTNIFEPF